VEIDLTLEDRIAKIQAINNQYNLLDNAYISFSGGKDSTVLHYVIDLALPNNNIPRVFINTGLEYKYIAEFVKELASKDNRFVIVNQTRNIKQTLQQYGYPFKSKEHSLRVEYFNKGTNSNYIKEYISGNGSFTCPKILLYQFKVRGQYNYSNQCCYKLKKDLAHKWQKLNHKPITITGMRNEEGGNRARLGCLSNNGKLFHPLIVVDEEWENNFIKEHNIKLCKLYYPPFNFTRTGCKGCPFALDLQKNLDTLKELLPNEYKQCMILWKPVYDEYKRIGYRLRRWNLFDFEGGGRDESKV